MRHRLKYITAEGYKSFLEKQTFRFDMPVGFYFLAGNNLLEPSLEGNDAGKSSLIGIPCWVLHGKDQNKLIAGNIGNWEEGKNCYGEVGIDEKILTRSWNPNFLLLDGEPVTQEVIDSSFNTNYDSFLFSTLFGQFSTKFFDMLPGKRLEMFASILSLERWEAFSKKAFSISRSRQDDLNELRSDISRLEGKIETLKDIDYSNDTLEWEKQRKQEIEEAEKQLATFVDNAEELDERKEILNKKRKPLSKELKDKEANLEKTNEILNKAKDSFLVKSRSYSLIGWEIDQSRKNLEKFENLTESVCPECGQEVPEEHIEKEILKYKNEIKNNERVNVLIHRKLKKAKSLLEDAEKEYDGIKDRVHEIKQNLRHLDGEILTIDKLLEQRFHSVELVEKKINRLEKQTNPFKEKEKEKKEKLSGLRKKLKKLLDEEASLEKSEAMSKFWVKGFRDIRLMVIEEALQELEISINDNIERLGLKDWRMKLLVDRETDSKTIKKGFEILVQSPYNKKLVPTDCWGGGAHGRLQVASTMGLSDFIGSRVSDFDVEFWDEPTSWLSNKGIEDLLEVLRDRAYYLNKRIFIIDHRDFKSFEFDRVYTIEKGERGSYII